MHISTRPEDLKFLDKAAEVAGESTCLGKKCGAIIVESGEIIGRGFNSPPGNLESQRRCGLDKKSLDRKITDKTCCGHAEWRAIIDALRNNPNRLKGSRLYYRKLDDDGNPSESGRPYCTRCSKDALDVGISEWVLLHKEGVTIYNSKEYNLLSYQYKSE